MTTLTHSAIGPAGSVRVPGHHIRLGYAIWAEWVKLRSTRSTWICLGLIFVVGLGLDVLITIVTANAWNPGATQDRLQYDPVRTAQAGMLVAQFIVGVLGVLMVTGEYSTGLIRTTLSSVSHRWSALRGQGHRARRGADGGQRGDGGHVELREPSNPARTRGKVVAHDSPALQATSKFIPVLSMTNPAVLRATLLVGVYITLLGLCGLALGFALRSTAGAMSVFVSVLLVVPVVTSMLPASIASHFNAYLPSALGSSMMVVTLRHNACGGDFFGPWTATAVLAGYALVLLAIGTTRLVARDA